jgi:DNA polymerase III psi subunit
VQAANSQVGVTQWKLHHAKHSLLVGDTPVSVALDATQSLLMRASQAQAQGHAREFDCWIVMRKPIFTEMN